MSAGPRERKRPADDADAPAHVQAARAHQDELDERADNQAADLSKEDGGTAAGADLISDASVLSAIATLRRYLAENGHADPLALGKARHDLRHPETGRYTPAPTASPATAAFERYARQGHPALTDGRAADSPANPPATARPGTAWPGADTLGTGPIAHAISAHGVPVHQVYSPTAPRPEPQAAIRAAQNPDHPEAAWPHGPLTASVQHVDLTGQRAALAVNPSPVQPPTHTAPSGAVRRPNGA